MSATAEVIALLRERVDHHRIGRSTWREMDHDIIAMRKAIEILEAEPQGEPSDAPRAVRTPTVLHIAGGVGSLCGVQKPSHVTDGTRYADCAACLAAAGGVR